MKTYFALALIAALACGTFYPVQADQADHDAIKEDTMPNLPFSREITLQPGQPVDATLVNSIQDGILFVANAPRFVPWHGNTVMVTLATKVFTSTGALESLPVELYGFEMSPVVDEAWTLQSVAFRVQDNGTDVWTCGFVVVDADNVETLIVTVDSLLTGGWEWVVVPVNHLFARGDRLRLSCVTLNSAGVSMLASGVLLVFPTV